VFNRTARFLVIMSLIIGVLTTASAVSALGLTRALRGTIIAIDSGTRSVTVSSLAGNQVRIKVVRSTVITRTGRLVNYSRLRVGDKVYLNYYVSTRQASDIKDSPGLYEIQGTIEGVDTTASTVTIASEEGGNSVTVKVDSSTVIERNDAPATLADLLVGDKVEAKYDSTTMLASSIQTEAEDSELYGTITAIDLTANTITITPESGGSDVVLNVSNSTVFIKDDAVVAFTDMPVGDKVEAEYDSTSMIASKIEVED
jgi:hypothetical protein